MHVFRIIDPARGEAGLIGGINALAAAFACGDRGVACVSNPMHAAKLDLGVLRPLCDVALASRVPVAFESKNEIHVGRDLRRKFARGIERRLVGGQIACWHLAFASWIHAGRQREVIGRNEHAASLGCGSAHIFLE